MDYIKKIPLIPKELVHELDIRFKQIPIKSDTDIDTIRYNAGQRSVIEYLKANIQNSIIEGKDVSYINHKDNEESLVSRLLNDKSS